MTAQYRATRGKPTTPPQADDPRPAIMAAVSNAVAELHAAEKAKRPAWFEHLLHRAERKAERIATQAALGEYSCGTATFAEVYAKVLPTLFTEALERLDSPERD